MNAGTPFLKEVGFCVCIDTLDITMPAKKFIAQILARNHRF
jgi:hypothetical protein